MTVSNLMIRTSRLSLLKLPTSQADVQSATMPFCQLKWRANKLWVKRVDRTDDTALPALESEQWLKACLEHSPIKAVCLDPALGERAIEIWANACEQAGKAVFLRIPPYPGLPKQRKPRLWQIKRVLDWLLAIWILIGLSPILLCFATLIYWSSNGSIFTSEWAVGYRGRLFRLHRFNVVDSNHQLARIEHWIQKCGLNKLPQLIHVVTGKMSLVGPQAWSLPEVAQADPSRLHCLKALPGVTGAKQLMARLSFCEPHPNNSPEFYYLKSWTLTRDIQFLMLAIPKALLGFSAY